MPTLYEALSERYASRSAAPQSPAQREQQMTDLDFDNLVKQALAADVEIARYETHLRALWAETM
ncbi:hypothetical protein AWB64_00143 [Caballeronia sordidicola]|uniref:Uncharacterized protein n=1 Tax=Caballeronia sordidicola TaxID=196367 RepID=A0A158EQR3_CABSO|nr:hypothetical protein AWB64_00143 [Caballeronia sordidicola]